MIVLDTETTGLNWNKNKVTHVGICDGTGFSMLDVNKFIMSDEHKYIMHHGRFDSLMLFGSTKRWLPWTYDTMLLSQLYDSRQKHSLDNLGRLYLGIEKWKDETHKKKKDCPCASCEIKRGGFWTLPRDTQIEYLRRDCELTWRLFKFFEEKLPKSLQRLYECFDNPVSVALASIERNGFTINEELLNEYKWNLSDQLGRISLELQSRYGDINFNSPQQLEECIRRTYNLELENTSERTLQIAQRYHPEIGALLQYRELNKYLNTYIKNIEDRLYNGKVYPEFHLAGDYHEARGRGTETGRTSSSNPNLQNQPRASSGPINIRSLFRSMDKHKLMAFDYSQLELKVGAFLTGDKNLLDGDIHAQAAKILHVDRGVGKTCNFALLYGASEPKIRFTSGGSKYVKEYIDWYKTKFKKAFEWTERIRLETKESGFCETYLGRKRYMDNSQAASNTCIQGSAGDIGKEALLRVVERGYRVLGLVHDELIVEVPSEELHKAAVDVPRLMTDGLINNKEVHAFSHLNVTVKVGDNWGCMNEYQNSDS